ncbi:MAG: VWA domain-containing protein [Candidatus Lokiarchaeota archaeon]|nr:VWA domain-containing protein [Candidatus Lokiarchaeota archaeon]
MQSNKYLTIHLLISLSLLTLSQLSLAQPNLTLDFGQCSYTFNDPRLSVTSRMLNNGTSAAGSNHMGFYLSSDANITTSDYRFYIGNISGIAAGSSTEKSITANLLTASVTPSLPAGTHTYYVGIIVDYQNEVAESNEGDNVWMFSNPITFNVPASQQVITNLNPSNYEVDSLSVGKKYHIDRDFALTSIPSAYNGLLFIRTAGDDKYQTASDFFTFNVLKAVTIYIAYDDRALSFPLWLTTQFSKTDDKIFTDDPELQYVRLWRKDFVPGLVVLGGNAATGASFNGEDFINYFVVIEEQNATGNISLTFNQIDADNFPVIDCYVTVTDQATGNPISGLSSSNFIVREDGTNEDPITVTPVGGGSAISVALAIDRSGSMGGTPLSDAKTAAIDFINQMNTSDRAAIISFSDNTLVDQGFTSNKSLLISAINGLSSGGGTALYDAIIESINQTTAQTGRKAIICLTDGSDNNSSATLQDCIDTALRASTPVFTIGLAVSTVSAQELRQIAQDTGGRYYEAPSSNDLQQIYQLISQQLQNQYKIVYTTHNTAMDGSTRNVEITISYQGSTSTKNRNYVAPSGGQAVPLKLIPPSNTQSTGSDFWVDIVVGDASKPVTNLYGISFVLNYTTAYLDVMTPHSSNVIAGSFLGSDLVFYNDVNEGSGKVSIGISRKSGAGGVNGIGTVLQLHFLVSNSAPDGTIINFSFTEVTANDQNGAMIQLDPQVSSISIVSGAKVWPGDTNNDGIVNQADVLPIGLYWNFTGSKRPNASISWVSQQCPFWSPSQATYADANGDGIINQADVLPIGLNWSKTHSQLAYDGNYQLVKKPANSSIIQPVTEASYELGEQFYVNIQITDVVNLFGLSFELFVDNKSAIELLQIHDGDFLGDDLVNFYNIDNEAGKVSVGLSRKTGQGGITGSGVVVKILMKVNDDTTPNQPIILYLSDVTANDDQGNIIDLKVVDTSFVIETGVREAMMHTDIPTEFALLPNTPNPFNPSTNINYFVPRNASINISVFNSLGEFVCTLVDGEQEPGKYSISWNGTDAIGQRVVTGLYFCRMESSGFIKTRKLLYIR